MLWHSCIIVLAEYSCNVFSLEQRIVWNELSNRLDTKTLMLFYFYLFVYLFLSSSSIRKPNITPETLKKGRNHRKFY